MGEWGKVDRARVICASSIEGNNTDVSQLGYHRSGCHRLGYHRSGYHRSGYHRLGYQKCSWLAMELVLHVRSVVFVQQMAVGKLVAFIGFKRVRMGEVRAQRRGR